LFKLSFHNVYKWDASFYIIDNK